MNIFRCATHTVGDCDAAAERFATWLGYETVERGRIDERLAASWRAPASAGRKFTVCRPASGAEVYLRFVEGPATPRFQPLLTHGWAAIELCVTDVHAVAARLADSPFEIIGPPSAVAGLPTIHPMQVRGPDAEILFLTQILTDAPDSGLPRAASLIDKPFILVLACADRARTIAWFARTLDVEPDPAVAVPYSMLNKAFGLSPGTLHELTTMRHGHDIFLEVDQYPVAATPRDQVLGELPPGVSIGTFEHPIDAIRADWIEPPSIREGAIYGGRRSGALRSPEGALVEIVDEI